MPRSTPSACIALLMRSRPSYVEVSYRIPFLTEKSSTLSFATHLLCPGIQILVATMRLSAVPVSLFATAVAALQTVQYGALYDPEHPFASRGGS